MVPVAVGLPPCCAGCAEYDREDRVCRLIADPTLENRRRLLAMPCDPQRLLVLRFRNHPPDVARAAVGVWLDPAWDPDDITGAYGRAPRDARLWLGSWAYLVLGRDAVRRVQRDGGSPQGLGQPGGYPQGLGQPGGYPQAPGQPGGYPQAPGRGPEAAQGDPALALRMTRALEKVHRVDPVGYAMLLDFLRDRFDAEAWAGALGIPAAAVADRKHLAIYRYAVYFHDVLDVISPQAAAVALSARRFSPGSPTEEAALTATRAALNAPDLSVPAFRQLYREGASRSLALLAAPDALGEEAMGDLAAPFRRVLHVDDGGSAWGAPPGELAHPGDNPALPGTNGVR
jgi:hypothetical protein